MIRTIGILGGGQLGRMLTLEAKRMGYRVVTLEPFPNSPTGQIADEQIVAAYDDLRAIGELGARSDVVTYEFENIPLARCWRSKPIAASSIPTPASCASRRNASSRKRSCASAASRPPISRRCGPRPNSIWRCEQVGFPAVLKTTMGGYDGKGQWVVRDRAAKPKPRGTKRAGAPLIWERFVPFDRELSIIATRDEGGDVVALPGLGERARPRRARDDDRAGPRFRRRSPIARTRTPTRSRRAWASSARSASSSSWPASELLVNEIAPRVHNSGHYSLDATQISQYELHVRAICGLPLVEPELFAPAVMVNILGSGEGDRLDGIRDVLRDPQLKLHLYGKTHASLRRKMGHFTVLGDSVDDAIARAERARAALHWADDRVTSRT